MATEYDFIVVGGGASGCVVAARLAQSASKPSVLLLEAGSSNKDTKYLVPADRFSLAFKEQTLNWGYKTVPQTSLQGQQIDYSRGKGLGGSTAINFCCWIIGADEDFNEWAELVGDDTWNWENVKQRFKKIEAYRCEVPKEHQKYINPKPEDHGVDGSLDLSYAEVWEKGLTDVFIAAEEIGLGTNPDVNSGNPIGMGMGAGCMYQGARTTSSSYLKNTPSNLTIVLDSPSAKVLFGGKKATGVETISGKKYYAKKDVILSAGALNSPQLLMLSGVGPAKELEKHGISVLHDLPSVGKNLQDHVFSPLTIIQREGTNDRMTFETNLEELEKHRAEHAKDKTGLMNTMYCSTPMGWFKNDNVLASAEFKALDKHTQEYLKKPTVPIMEIATHVPPLYVGEHILQPTDSYLTVLAFAQNPKSEGEVTLTSSNPADPPAIDPKLMSHPFDRRVAIESMRTCMKYLNAPVFKSSTVKFLGPKSDSDEDIWEHVSSTLMSSWHMCRTIRMGKKDDENACLDTDFRVRGVENLRVVDLSAIPLLPNNHTQSTAYLVGETAAEKIIAEYGLDQGDAPRSQL